jgi:hypothetical protein
MAEHPGEAVIGEFERGQRSREAVTCGYAATRIPLCDTSLQICKRRSNDRVDLVAGILCGIVKIPRR